MININKSADNCGSVHICQGSLHKETSWLGGASFAVPLLLKPLSPNPNITES